MLKPNVPAWFELPARDVERAQRFYEDLLGVSLIRTQINGVDQAIFPHGGKPNASGSVVRWDGVYEPSDRLGSLVYLHLDDIRPALARVAQVGGEVLLPAQELPDNIGMFAHIRDSEGNRVGLFSTV
jgi:predicted enzyme related to lactoylglutathione lyase